MTRRHLTLVAPPMPDVPITWADFIGRECSPELAVVLRFASELHYEGVEIEQLYSALQCVCTYESEFTLEADREAESVFAESALASVMLLMDPGGDPGPC